MVLWVHRTDLYFRQSCYFQNYRIISGMVPKEIDDKKRRLIDVFHSVYRNIKYTTHIEHYKFIQTTVLSAYDRFSSDHRVSI